MAQAFNPGDKVTLHYGFVERGSNGIYEIVRALPASPDAGHQYRVKSSEGYDRAISADQIRARVSPTLCSHSA